MPVRDLDSNNLGQEEDWEGNNAAFRCPLCGKVFIVSGRIHGGGRAGEASRNCPGPGCGKSVGVIRGGKKSDGYARLKWPD
jgi:hypothetical protein